MSMKSRTYVVNVNGLTPFAEAQVREWLEALLSAPGQSKKTPDGLLLVEWSAYKAGHDCMAPRVSSLNLGIAIAMGRHGPAKI